MKSIATGIDPRLLGCAVAMTLFFTAVGGVGYAGSLVYTPINPSFGGSPNNGAFLQNEAAAQNQYPTKKVVGTTASTSGGGSSGSSSAPTPGQIFAQQLQSQLLSSFANQITQAIFGPNAQQSGSFAFGQTSIQFAKTAGQISISINDGQSITNITVPSSN